MTTLQWINEASIWLFCAGLIAAAATDLFKLRIPNRIVLAVIAFYPIFVLTADKPVDWVRSLLVAVIVLLVGIGMFAYKLIGGGDAKLIAAAALWAGPAHITPLLMTTAIGGGLLCVFAVSPLRTFLPYLAAAAKLDADMAHLMKLHIPYGVAIAAGGLFVAARLF